MLRLPNRRSFAVLGLAFGAGLASPAVASEQVADLTYDVYLGGLHIFTFDVSMALQPQEYRVDATGGTQGMMGWLYDWQMKLAAEGRDADGRVAAQRYTVQSDWKDTPRNLALTFGGDGTYDLQQTPPPEPDPDIQGGLPESLPLGTLDPLSLALSASRTVAQSGRCDQSIPVFDGRRRFDLTVRHVGETTLPANEYSIYQGPAIRCSFSIERISGFRKSWKSTRQWDAGSETPPSIWLAPLRPDWPPMPVRYEGTIALGSIVIHLTKAELQGGPAGGVREAEAGQ